MRLADGAYLTIAVTPLNNRYAAIKPITTNRTVPNVSYQKPIFEIIKSTLPKSLCFIGGGVLRDCREVGQSHYKHTQSTIVFRARSRLAVRLLWVRAQR